MKHFPLVLLLLSFIFTLEVNGQTPPPSSPACVYCGGRGGVHAASCRYYAGHRASETKTTPIIPGGLQQLNSLVDLFSSPDTDSKTSAEKDAEIKRLSERKAHEERIRLERNNRLKAELKPIEFIPINQSQSPLTMEERARQNIIKKGGKVTWNFDEFASVDNSASVKESAPTPELTPEEATLNSYINYIESYNLGKVAALTGRFMVNINKEVMSYLDDASSAALEGNVFKMQESANLDLRKLVSNALINTGKQTLNAYAEQGIEAIKGEVDKVNFAIIKSGTIKVLKYSPSSGAWKVPPGNYTDQKK